MTYQPAPIARESLIGKAAEEIRRLIRERRLAAGALLPPETQLSRMLGISRNSLREALRILDGLGFVEKHPGRRVVVGTGPRAIPVSAVEPQALAEALPAAHAARMIVEERCAALAARAATEADIAEMAGHLALFEEALKREDAPSASQAHLAFHGALVRSARNPILAAVFRQLSFAVAELGARAQETLKERRQGPMHAAILDAIRARDPQRAAGAVRAHFRAVAALVAFVTRGIEAGADGRGPAVEDAGAAAGAASRVERRGVVTSPGAPRHAVGPAQPRGRRAR
jgi:GntR family transcriptional repressor for pyruvate dehydrogenase complex